MEDGNFSESSIPVQGGGSGSLGTKPSFGVQRQYSQISEGVSQDVFTMLAEMNRKMDAITDKGPKSERE